MKPRVLLVEDDASIRRFVELALDEHAIELLQAPTLAAARAVLQGGPVALVLCDLMLPDGSGFDLLREPAAQGPRRVAFSAGVSAAQHQLLQQAGVHAVLRKPVALGELLACVETELAAWAEAAAPALPGPADPTPTPGPTPAPDPSDPVARYFAGDAALYRAYREQCRPQFAQDAQDGERACASADWPALRRLAHSLKTVLQTLGEEPAGRIAAELEHATAAADGAQAHALWPRLRQALEQLARA